MELADVGQRLCQDFSFVTRCNRRGEDSFGHGGYGSGFDFWLLKSDDRFNVRMGDVRTPGRFGTTT
jgi:hypothetical protein